MTFAALTLTLERRLHTTLRDRADRRSRLPPHLLTGERGEDAAFFHLREHGYTVVARRWRSDRSPGDLDLIAWDGPTLVFVEVKTRTARDLIPAEFQVDTHKQEILRRLAHAYLRRLPERHRDNIPVRFDVVSVYLLGSAAKATTEIEHFPNAFPRHSPPRRRF